MARTAVDQVAPARGGMDEVAAAPVHLPPRVLHEHAAPRERILPCGCTVRQPAAAIGTDGSAGCMETEAGDWTHSMKKMTSPAFIAGWTTRFMCSSTLRTAAGWLKWLWCEPGTQACNGVAQ